ncbi:MAG: hypothetical protein NT075_09215, partial [Chloroflexi bacterium]|nr:hypothetical protein [Chloroflexota bacterium]
LPAETVKQMQLQAKQMTGAATFAAIKRFNATIQDLKGGYHPQLPLELALIESIQGESLAAPAQLAAPVMAPATNVPVAAPLPQVTVASPPPTAPATPVVTSPVPAEATIAKAVEPVPAAIEPPPLDGAAIQKLNTRWKEFMVVVRSQCGVQVQAALKAVKDIAVGEQTVALAFGANEFSRDMVARPDTLPKVAAILSTFVGRSVILECQVGEQAKLARMINMSPSQQQLDGPDPLVEYALSDLGAEVV